MPLHRVYHKSTGLTFSLISAAIILAIVTGIITLAPPTNYNDVFTNLDEVEAYAHSINELTPMEGINTLKPDFSSYYATQNLTNPQRIKEKIVWLLYRIGLVNRPVWSITGFKTVLERLSQRNEDNNFKDTIIAKISATHDDRFIVFGALQGAFHSLLRDLQQLEKMGIINRSMTIIKPHHYIIFMGEAVDRSAFTLETLSLIMKVLEANSNNALYLRGGHESKNYWQEHTLKTELLIRAHHISSSKIPLEKEVNRFFNTLPLAFYIGMHPSPTKDFIRLSKRGIGSDPLLEEKNYGPFLSTLHTTITPYTVKNNAELSDAAVTIRAIIKSEKKRYAYQSMEGLRMLPNDTGVTAWTLLSCPTVVYEKAKGMSFFFDAFAIITPGEKLSQWTITLHHRDRRTNNPFSTKTFNLLSGLEDGVVQPKDSVTKEDVLESPTNDQETPSANVITAPDIEVPKTPKASPGETPLPIIKKQEQTKTEAATNNDITIVQQQGAPQLPLINLTVGDKPTTVTITVTTQQDSQNTNSRKENK